MTSENSPSKGRAEQDTSSAQQRQAMFLRTPDGTEVKINVSIVPGEAAVPSDENGRYYVLEKALDGNRYMLFERCGETDNFSKNCLVEQWGRKHRDRNASHWYTGKDEKTFHWPTVQCVKEHPNG